MESETQPLLEAPYRCSDYEGAETNLHREELPSPAPGKYLSWTSAYILVVSRVIGSGIFATPGSIVKSSGSVGLSLLLWVVGTILAACGMAVSMEYGCMLPRSGGEKVYLEYTYPRPRFLASTLVAVQAVLLGFTASNCIIFAKYTFYAFGGEPTELQHKLIAAGLLTLITVVHGCFRQTGIWIQNFLGWLKIFLIASISLTGIWVILLKSSDLPTGSSESDKHPFAWDVLWEGSNWSWNLLSTSLFKVLYSYAGLSNANNVLSEVRDPVQTLKTVCPAALLTSGVLYLLANASYFLVIPIDEIKHSGELVAALLFERLFGPHFGGILFPLAIAISAAGNVMVVTFALVGYPRMTTCKSNEAGTSQPGNRPTRVPSLGRCLVLLQALRHASLGIDSPLLPFSPGNHTAATGRCVQLHLGCGRLSRYYIWHRSNSRTTFAPL